MKKLITIVFALLVVSAASFGQTKFGVKAGLNFNTLTDVTQAGNTNEAWNAQTGYHIGLAIQMKVPFLGLAIQPELLYNAFRTVQDPTLTIGQTRPTINGDMLVQNVISGSVEEISLDYITLPVNFEFGIDLVLLRPFVVVSPYIQYAIQKGAKFEEQPWSDINRFDYGVGLGVGLDLWKLQIMGKYNWGLGKLQSAGADWDQADTYKNAKLQGFQLSVAFLF